MSWGLRQTLIVSVGVMDAGREGSLQKGGVSLLLLLLGIPLLEVTGICPLVKRVGELFINAQIPYLSLVLKFKDNPHSEGRICPGLQSSSVAELKIIHGDTATCIHHFSPAKCNFLCSLRHGVSCTARLT